MREDRDLVVAAQGGDRAALDELLRRHYNRIYAICRRITGNDADAADATQDALMAIVRGLANFDGRAKFSTWSYRVATNSCLDELRRRKRRPVPASGDDDYDPVAEQPDPADAEFEARLVERDVMQTALAGLADEFRIPVILRDVAGLDYAEIAETLAIAPGTVRSRISRGRAKLAESVRIGNQMPDPQRPTTQP